MTWEGCECYVNVTMLGTLGLSMGWSECPPARDSCCVKAALVRPRGVIKRRKEERLRVGVLLGQETDSRIGHECDISKLASNLVRVFCDQTVQNLSHLLHLFIHNYDQNFILCGQHVLDEEGKIAFHVSCSFIGNATI